ncbi:MAG TPA: AraC family transcriptional regulator [Azospirillum sp.]|nr:AraC family transcriptional regulator [Azospirillum sp.]
MGAYRLEPTPLDQERPVVRKWELNGLSLQSITSPAIDARGGHSAPAICSLFRPSTGLFAINSDRLRRLDAAPGDLSYYPANTDFRISCGAPHNYAIVNMTSDRLASITADVCDDDPATLDVTMRIRTPNAIHLAHLLHSFVTGTEAWGMLYLESLLNLVVAEAIRQARPAPTPLIRSSLSPTVLRRVLGYIEEHIADDVSLELLASVAGLSPYHFARCFRQDTGKPPFRYIMDRRLERAGSLLATAKLPIADIAAQCGFSSASHFSTVFRKAFGVAPMQYRADRSELASPFTAFHSTVRL